MTYTPVQATAFADSMNLDAFSRVRVSQGTGIFSVQCQYDAEPLLMEAGKTGTGVVPAHDANVRMVAAVATAGSGTSFFQSYEYIPYQPGKSQLVFATFVLGAGVAGAVVDVGLFDADNGYFLRQNGASGLQLVRRTKTSGAVVDNVVEQADWNLNTLASLDITKAQILVLDAQYLGMGRARVAFDIGGVLVPVHQFLNANILSVPYMQTLTLPIQMLVTATATGSTKTSYFKCASVSSEGGFADDIGYTNVTPEQSVNAASGAQTHILSIRPAATFNSITNRTRFRAESLEILVTGANPVYWQLCVGSTFSAGPTYTAVGATSAFEYSSAVGTLATAGAVVQAGYISGTVGKGTAQESGLSAKYPISLNRAGAVRANGVLSLLVTGIAGASATRALINFREIR